MKNILFFATGILFIFFSAGCNSTRRISNKEEHPVVISKLRLIGHKDVPYNFSFKKTTVGGLSGIDYDSAANLYYLISDDRSAINPARFYTARIKISQNAIDSIEFVDVHFLMQQGGAVYPNNKQDPGKTPDPEAIRIGPGHNQLTWSSEGERIVGKRDTVLQDPSINIISTDGSYAGNFPIPSNLRMHSSELGPRQNGVLEGMSYSPGGRLLFVNVEEPLYEDAPRADVIKNNAWIRILKFNTSDKSNTAQYAYELDPIAHPAVPATAFKINGVPDVLALGDTRLLIIERSFSSGRLACTIKVFQAELASATNIKDVPSLKAAPSFIPVSKKLLLNMDDLGMYIDNIEGVTFGPRLGNGHQTLVFVADNNFDPLEKTQLLLFEID